MGISRRAHYLAQTLLVLDGLLVAGLWYLQPERTPAWTAAALLLAVMTVALVLATRRAATAKTTATASAAARRQAGDAITNGVVSGALIVALALAAKLGGTLGLIEAGELSQRATMAILGGFIMFTGNALPKTLRPLSTPQRDARIQACQRFAGWTWTLTGLAFALAWLVLPMAIAQPVSLLLLMTGMLTIVSRLFGWRGSWQKPA